MTYFVRDSKKINNQKVNNGNIYYISAIIDT